MSFHTYWLIVAPAFMVALSGIGWLGLWFTRDRKTAKTSTKPPH